MFRSFRPLISTLMVSAIGILGSLAQADSALSSIAEVGSPPDGAPLILDLAEPHAATDPEPGKAERFIFDGVFWIHAADGNFVRWRPTLPPGETIGDNAVWSYGVARLYFRGTAGDERRLYSLDLDGHFAKLDVAQTGLATDVSADGKFAAQLQRIMTIGAAGDHATVWIQPLNKPPAPKPKRKKNGFGSIGLSGSNTGDRTALTLDARTIALSPTADQIAYAQESMSTDGSDGSYTRSARVLVATTEGKNARPLLDGLTEVTSLRWSPDGRSIGVLARDPSSKLTALWVVVIEDGKKTRVAFPAPVLVALSSNAFAGVASFSWSPDSDRLAALYDGAGPCWQGGRDLGSSGCYAALYTIHADGSAITRVSPRYQRGGQIFWVR